MFKQKTTTRRLNEEEKWEGGHHLAEEFDFDVAHADRIVHFLVAFQDEHKEGDGQVTEQVTRSVRVHFAVASHRTLLQKKQKQ